SNPFNGFGYLKLQVRRADNSLVCRNQYLHGFGLAFDGNEHFDSITPLLVDGIVVAREIFAPKDTTYLRYFDSFTNVSDEERIVEVAWGGAAGAYDDGGRLAVATTSNGDHYIDLTDSFVTVMQNAKKVADPMAGPSGAGPSAHALGSKTAGLLTEIGDMYGNPFLDKWPGFDTAHIGYAFTLKLKPGQSAALMTFVVKGKSEVYDPRGGLPTTVRDRLVTPNFGDVYSGKNPKIPAAGSEIARVSEVAKKLISEPDLRGLTARQVGEIANWNLPPRPTTGPFTVFEKTVSQLQDAMTRGETT